MMLPVQRVEKLDTLKEGVRRCVASPRSCTPPLDSPHRKKVRSHA